MSSNIASLTLLHSEWPKLYGVLAILSAIIGLIDGCLIAIISGQWVGDNKRCTMESLAWLPGYMVICIKMVQVLMWLFVF